MRKLFQCLKTIIAAIQRQRMAQEHFEEWSNHVRSADQLSPEEQKEWCEEERSKWHDYYDQLL
jgi:hypothetical protein